MRPTKAEMRAQFNRYNAQFFGGALPEIRIHWARMGWEGDYFSPLDCPPHGRIRLGTLMAEPKCGWRGILLHEMIHAALDVVGVDEFDSEGPQDHGPAFAAECNRIGAAMGIPPVCQALAWCWPGHDDDAKHPEPSIED